MLTVVYDEGPRFGIGVGRPVALRDGVPHLETMIANRFAKTKPGQLQPDLVLRDVLVAVGMTPAEAHNALRRLEAPSGR